MKLELILKIQPLIDTFNHRQRSIAIELLSNPFFEITEIHLYGKGKIVIKDLQKDEVYDFEVYVKSKCNCG